MMKLTKTNRPKLTPEELTPEEIEELLEKARIRNFPSMKELKKHPALDKKSIKGLKRAKQCYRLTYELITDFSNKDWVLVHALLTHDKIPCYIYDHAFLMKGDCVYDTTQNKFYNKDDYFTFYKIKTAFYYSIWETFNVSSKYRHYGPWERIMWTRGFYMNLADFMDLATSTPDPLNEVLA